MRGEFAQADGLVLDLRGGWGGAVAEYTDAFNPAHPFMQMRGREGGWSTVSRVWDKPLVILIDEGTRSGKEMVSDALQRAGVATLVGTPTAGAVLGGTTFPLSDGSLLMVAVADVRLDGRRLEANPVEPDVFVERPLPYCNGADPQLEAGYAALLDAVRAARPL
jgi:carboxyl-terminal processing protease